MQAVDADGWFVPRTTDAQPGAYASVGAGAQMAVRRLLAADGGIYLSVGVSAALAKNAAAVYALSSDAGQYSTQGQNAALVGPAGEAQENLHPVIRVSRYSMRLGGRLVYADTPQALQAAIEEFEASIPDRAEARARGAGKVVMRRLPRVQTPTGITVTLSYWAKIPALSGGSPTNWLLDAHPNMYLLECLRQLAVYTKDDSAIQRYAEQLQGYYTAMKRADTNRRFGGAALRVRPA